jgi:hypothetical protein
VCNFNLADALSFHTVRYHSIFRLLPRLVSAERNVSCVLMRVLCDRVEMDADAGDIVGARAMTSTVSSINLNSTLVASHLSNMNDMNYSTMAHRLNGDTSSHIEGDRTDPHCRASSLSRPVRVVFSQGGATPELRTDQIYKANRTNEHLTERLYLVCNNTLNDLCQV